MGQKKGPHPCILRGRATYCASPGATGCRLPSTCACMRFRWPTWMWEGAEANGMGRIFSSRRAGHLPLLSLSLSMADSQAALLLGRQLKGTSTAECCGRRAVGRPPCAAARAPARPAIDARLLWRVDARRDRSLRPSCAFLPADWPPLRPLILQTSPRTRLMAFLRGWWTTTFSSGPSSSSGRPARRSRAASSMPCSSFRRTTRKTRRR